MTVSPNTVSAGDSYDTVSGSRAHSPTGSGILSVLHVEMEHTSRC